MTSQYERYFYWLGQLTSGDVRDPSSVDPKQQYSKFENPLTHTGKIGKYQMTENQLAGLGYYILADGDSGLSNRWRGSWSGRRNIKSLDDFLNTPDAQEIVIREAMRRHWRLIRLNKLDDLVGTKAHGVLLTESTLLAIAQLMGDEGMVTLAPKSKAMDDLDFDNLTQVAGFQTPYDVDSKRDYYQEQFREFLSGGPHPTLNLDLSSIRRKPVNSYVWCTQGDDKVRPAHAAKEGESFNTDASPAPGQDYNCRCWAENCLIDFYSAYRAHQENLKRGAEYLISQARKNKKPTGQCAHYVADSVRNPSGANLGLSYIPQPGYAKDYGQALVKAGYTAAVTVNSQSSYPPEGYTPQIGDIVIMQGFGTHVAGHMEEYTNEGWASDYIQHGFWPSSDYEKAQPSYIIYRSY